MTPLAQGLPASPGAASGRIVFDADTAEVNSGKGERVILVREETKPEDIHGFFAAVGILTSRGGKTSHAAVVARGMGKPCVSGCEAIAINVRERVARVGGTLLHEGDTITIDGTTGHVFAGEIPTVEPEFSDRAGNAAGMGRPDGAAQGDGQCRYAARRGSAHGALAPTASGCAVPSACSTTSIVCRSCRT